MKTQFRASFAQDLRSIKDKAVLKQAAGAIERVEQAQTLQDIGNLKKLRGTGNFFRIRLGEYRLGLVISGDTVAFVRCLHRREIYRYFP